MGYFDLSSLEAFKKQATNVSSSNNDSSNNYSSNLITGGESAQSKYSISLFGEEEEEKTVANAYDDFFEETIFGSEEEKETTTADANKYQQELDTKYKDDNNLSAQDTFSTLTNAGILNERYYDRMICATEKLVQNTDWLVSIADENGNISDMALADAVAASFDSELDLYIQDIVQDVMNRYGTCSKGYLSDSAKAELAAKGIRVDSVGQGTEEDGSNTNRVYSFSLVQLPDNFEDLSVEEQMAIVYADDAKIVEDKAGNKGSYLFADCLIPDGFAQNAEINLSSILDTMGYDCISKADFIGSDGKFNENEYLAMLAEVGEMVNSGELSGRDSINDIYGNTREISDAIRKLWGGDGAAPGQFGIGGGSSSGSNLTPAEKAKLNQEYKEQYEKVLKKLKSDYKEEHGEEATGKDLTKLESEATQKVKIQL